MCRQQATLWIPLAKLVRFATLGGLFATIAASAPVSRFVLAIYPQVPYTNTRALLATDSAGNSYLAGTNVADTLAPIHAGGPQGVFSPQLAKVGKDGQVAFIQKLQGGQINAITVGPTGDVYLAGASIGTPAVDAPDFHSSAVPAIQATSGAYNATPALGFVARYSPDGNVVFVAILASVPSAIAVDPSGGIYLTGSAGTSFTATRSGFQLSAKGNNAFVAKLSSDGTQLVYATFLGGTRDDMGSAIAVDVAGEAIIAGNTNSNDFPLSSGPPADSFRIFVSRLDPSGSRLLTTTIMGGSGVDSVSALAIDSEGAAYVAGTTTSPNFPVSPGAFQSTFGGSADAFLFKLDAAGGIGFSTFLGSSDSEGATAMVLNADGRVYVAVDSADIHPQSNFPGAFYGTLLNRSRMECDPWSTLVGLDRQSGNLVDFEPLIGFGSASLAADPSGILHVFGTNDTTNGDFILTDGHFAGILGGNLFALVDFARTDAFQPACIANIADHTQSFATTSGSFFPVSNSLLPGEIVTIQGKGLGPAQPWSPQSGVDLPYQVANTQVTLDGNPLPLISVSNTEIRAVIPYSQPGMKVATLVIQNGDAQFTDSFIVGQSGASVFTRDDSGLVAALNQDGTPNSLDNPAPRGSVITFFASGLGPLTPSVPDNAWTPPQPPFATPVNPIAVYITPVPSGAVGLPISYIGPAPSEVPGIYQINAQIPNLDSTGKVPIAVGQTLGSGHYLRLSDNSLWIAVK